MNNILKEIECGEYIYITDIQLDCNFQVFNRLFEDIIYIPKNNRKMCNCLINNNKTNNDLFIKMKDISIEEYRQLIIFNTKTKIATKYFNEHFIEQLTLNEYIFLFLSFVSLFINITKEEFNIYCLDIFDIKEDFYYSLTDFNFILFVGDKINNNQTLIKTI